MFLHLLYTAQRRQFFFSSFGVTYSLRNVTEFGSYIRNSFVTLAFQLFAIVDDGCYWSKLETKNEHLLFVTEKCASVNSLGLYRFFFFIHSFLWAPDGSKKKIQSAKMFVQTASRIAPVARTAVSTPKCYQNFFLYVFTFCMRTKEKFLSFFVTLLEWSFLWIRCQWAHRLHC